MENTEVMNIEELEVMEPVDNEEEETALEPSLNPIPLIAVGVAAATGVYALGRFVVKPLVKNACRFFKRKAREFEEKKNGDVSEGNVTEVEFEEVSENE